jgi:hypothetical protein
MRACASLCQATPAKDYSRKDCLTFLAPAIPNEHVNYWPGQSCTNSKLKTQHSKFTQKRAKKTSKNARLLNVCEHAMAPFVAHFQNFPLQPRNSLLTCFEAVAENQPANKNRDER